MIIITSIVPEFLINSFIKKGYKVLYDPLITYDRLSKKIKEAIGIVVTTRVKVDKALMEKAPNLKWIGRLGSGLELIDLDYAKSRGIRCISTPEGNRNAVAEHSLGMLLSLMQNIHKSSAEVAKNLWLREENRGIEIDGKTVGIIGYGNTGKRFAEIVSGLNATVLVYDKYKFDFSGGKIKEANLKQICKYSDVISFNLPLNDETFHYGNEEFFDSLQGFPIIINASRGKIIKTAALISALKSGKVSGAGLDVLENEKLDTFSKEEKKELKFLTTQPNVIVTPHIAGYSFEAFKKMSEVLLKKLKI
ncbi:MAG: NAD(P)-dependent oxidoreductase [Ferruginibacter sp.]